MEVILTEDENNLKIFPPRILVIKKWNKIIPEAELNQKKKKQLRVIRQASYLIMYCIICYVAPSDNSSSLPTIYNFLYKIVSARNVAGIKLSFSKIPFQQLP